MRKPNLFIVGAAKAGTTSLASYLEQHPDIFFSPIKEPNHFNTEVILESLREDHKRNTFIDFNSYFRKPTLEAKHLAFVKDRNTYLKLFREGGERRYYAEASTGYLYSPVAAKNIFDFNPSSKIIIILREPVSRTISHLLMDFSRGYFKETEFIKALKNDFESSEKGYCKTNLYLDLSLYSAQLERYFDVFPKENMIIVDFENLKNSPNIVLKEIFRLLDLPNYQIDFESKMNQTLVPRFGIIRKLRGFKKLFPSSWAKRYKFLFAPFKKQPGTFTIPDNVKTYISDIVKDDWSISKEYLK